MLFPYSALRKLHARLPGGRAATGDDGDAGDDGDGDGGGDDGGGDDGNGDAAAGAHKRVSGTAPGTAGNDAAAKRVRFGGA